MGKQNPHDNQEFIPEDAFLYAFDEAIGATAECLRSAGLDESAIWAAFQRSLGFLLDSAKDLETPTTTAGPAPTILLQRGIQLSHHRLGSLRKAASA